MVATVTLSTVFTDTGADARHKLIGAPERACPAIRDTALVTPTSLDAY